MEKTLWASKKFWAFLISLIITAGVLIVALLTQTWGLDLMVFGCVGIFGIVFIASGYILGQASLDKLVRGIGYLKGSKNSDEED